MWANIYEIYYSGSSKIFSAWKKLPSVSLSNYQFTKPSLLLPLYPSSSAGFCPVPPCFGSHGARICPHLAWLLFPGGLWARLLNQRCWKMASWDATENTVYRRSYFQVIRSCSPLSTLVLKLPPRPPTPAIPTWYPKPPPPTHTHLTCFRVLSSCQEVFPYSPVQWPPSFPWWHWRLDWSLKASHGPKWQGTRCQPFFHKADQKRPCALL